MIEKLDVYNKNKEKTGKTIERNPKEKLEKGEYIIAVQCWIINSDGNILLTQRKLNKKHGGMWEPTSGLVISGENSVQGIKRELLEEIGIDISENDLKICKEIIEERENVSFLRDIYVLRKDISLNTLNFKDGEVINAKYVSIEEFLNMINQGESFEWLKYFVDLYKSLLY
ncbi:MAG: NUDIX domain-containing protein [Clostridia bacterium]|nr:NUDIX domain-containing protein [Clostridia bacterium]